MSKGQLASCMTDITWWCLDNYWAFHFIYFPLNKISALYIFTYRHCECWCKCDCFSSIGNPITQVNYDWWSNVSETTAKELHTHIYCISKIVVTLWNWRVLLLSDTLLNSCWEQWHCSIRLKSSAVRHPKLLKDCMHRDKYSNRLQGQTEWG